VKIVKLVPGDNYFILHSNNTLVGIDGIKSNSYLKDLVVNLCATKHRIVTSWTEYLVIKFAVIAEFETIEDLAKLYPEYLI
jgi:hypothetical protein